jgi:arylsulfatase A-like enzyme
MVKRHYGISTERYKLIHYYYDIDEWELYDRKSDPEEMKNVYNDPSYASVARNLHKRLQKLMINYGDSIHPAHQPALHR